MKHISAYWQTCVLSLLTVALFVPLASATTIVMPTDEQLVAKSPDIVEGTVLSSVPVQIGNRIWTETQVVVSRTIKGDAAGTITIRELGGQLGDHITKYFGTPEYTVGENVLLFLTPTPRGDYQTMDLFVGKFTADQMLDGTPMWVRNDQTANASLLDAGFHPMRPGNSQRAAQGFEQFIADRVSGRTGAHAYAVQNPMLRSVVGTGGGQRFKAVDYFAVFTDNGIIYRWPQFDQGQAANWYSYGTQPGYAGGGVNEVKTAMNAWSGYSGANIKYVYVGSEASGGSMDTQNGKNEVLFNDPFGDISGSWNPATGGVVGLGGINTTSGTATFTAPFTADATHPAGPTTYYRITESNLTVQDGVSSNASIPSNELAEIIAHEFGHTLGFDHSSDSTALMYYAVTGLGPSLRADDQKAAAWLYPNGSYTPPASNAPAAPTNLTGVQSGSSIVLKWTDNANNETAEQIYAAVGNGSFYNVANVGAGVTTATLNGFNTGAYKFYVTASNSSGTSAASNTVSVNYSGGSTTTPAPTAAFTVNPSSGIAGQTTFTFTDQSTGTITSRLWTFGDGQTATNVTNPTHVYANAGVYTVTLTVTNGNGSNSATTNIAVTASIPTTPNVAPAFTFNPSNPVTAQVISFTDQSTGSPASWAWDFGDGVTSTAQNPTHAYAYAGQYTITLSVRNAASYAFATHSINVTAAQQTSRTLVSAAAQTSGVGGSTWRTELTLFNAGSETLPVNLIYIPSYGNAVQTRQIPIGAKQTITYSNALGDLYGISNGAGAIAIEATASNAAPQLRVTSRTFTDGVTGTYGQAVPTVGSSDFSGNLYLTGVTSNADFRTNVGLVNRGGSDAAVTLRLVSAAGVLLASANVVVPANNFQQTPISQLFPLLSTLSFDSLSMNVTSNAPDAISVYASVIDNKTQDPVYIQATPGGASSPMILPAVGRAPGVGGTFWRSDVTVYNPGASSLTLTMRYLASSKSLSVGAGQTVVLADVLQQFNVASGSGALELSWTGGVSPIVTSRTYTPAVSGGTYGQSIDPIQAFGSDMYVTGLRSDSSFRSNVGFVNNSDQTIAVSLTLYASSGTPVATGLVTLAPRSQTQSALSTLFPNAAISTLGSVTLHAHNDAGAMFAYGSMVDNNSGDPVFFAGR